MPHPPHHTQKHTPDITHSAHTAAQRGLKLSSTQQGVARVYDDTQYFIPGLL